jgi:uncharacterized protein (TIGR02171 family)
MTRSGAFFSLSMFRAAAAPALFCASAFMLGCAPNDSKPPSVETRNGMRLIIAAGASFLQGAEDSLASIDEKPAFSSGFSYNYWMDTTEVTQQEYTAVTGRQPVPDTGAVGRGPNFPVCYVSWYDAILFCNQKSKRDSLDTVYDYISLSRLPGGSVYEITGLTIDYSKNGYRLPTEAEWEFAGRGASSDLVIASPLDRPHAGAIAWFSENSGGSSHPAAQKQPNRLGLYDMAGNLFEWTGDWKGFYQKRAITNSIGGREPEASFERVIKGGSFRDGLYTLRPTRRGATYAVGLSSAVDYIGFRCASGAIHAPAYITADTGAPSTNSVRLLASDPMALFGVPRARLVFVNVTASVRTLCSVDFGSPNPYVHEFLDFTQVYVPSLSPDGRFAAYCTRGDGATGAAQVYIRSLDSLSAAPVKLAAGNAFKPRWWADRITGDTFLVYTTSAIDNADAQWPLTKTIIVKMAGGAPTSVMAELVSDGSFHDGLSPTAQYVVTGYTRLIMRDRFNKIERQLFTYPNNGKGPSGSTQACNVSIAPDTLLGGGRCLFLDFGTGQETSSITGTRYGVHEYLLMAGFNGSVLSWYKCPPGEASWDHAEWSNAERFAVSGSRDAANDMRAIWAIDLVSSTYRKIVEGTELAHPALWMASPTQPNPDSLSLDSLGRYLSPLVQDNQQFFTNRMLPFWRRHSQMEIVFFGSSHFATGIDPRYFTVKTPYNMGMDGGDLAGSLTCIKNYALNHCPLLKCIGLDIMIGWLNRQGGSQTFSIGVVLSKGYNYDKNHGFWASGLPQNFKDLIGLAPCPVFPTIDELGLEHQPTLGWGGADPLIEGAIDWSAGDANVVANLDSVRALSALLAAKGIHLVLVVMPESPYYRSTAVYTRYGPTRAEGEKIIANLDSLALNNPYCHFYDANLGGNHDYEEGDAHDWDHLSEAGAKKLSQRLDSLVHAILNY